MRIPPGFHVEIPCGMVESTWNIGGRKSPKWVRSQPKHIPCGMGRFHVEQHGFHIDSTWNPCGIRGQGKDLQKNMMEHEGGIDTAREWAYKVCPQGFLSFLSTDYSNSTMSHASIVPHIIGPRPWTSPHRPMPPWHGQWSSHTWLLTTTTLLKHWGACSAPQLYHFHDFPILARLHGSVDWHLHCPCEIYWPFLAAYPSVGWGAPGFS